MDNFSEACRFFKKYFNLRKLRLFWFRVISALSDGQWMLLCSTSNINKNVHEFGEFRNFQWNEVKGTKVSKVVIIAYFKHHISRLNCDMINDITIGGEKLEFWHSVRNFVHLQRTCTEFWIAYVTRSILYLTTLSGILPRRQLTPSWITVIYSQLGCT